jgi:nucleotide-binding universal stress UspA family protein
MKTPNRSASQPTQSESKSRFQIRSILVPVDFSKASSKALAYASALAEQFDAKVTLLYVIEPIAVPDFMAAFPLALGNDEVTETCRERLGKFARKAGVKNSLIEKALVRHGRPFAEITDAARTLKVDLIVISTNGYSGLNHALLGSVTERVVRVAPCPVLVVRENEHEFISA